MVYHGKKITTGVQLILLLNAVSAFGSVCSSFSGPVAQFCNLSVADQACVVGNLTVGGTLIGGDVGYANTLIVDKDGNDAIATRANKLHFQTISAALAQALPGDLVWVFQGVYEESITVPQGVYLVGNAQPTIQMLNVTDPTDLVTLMPGTQLNGFKLILTAGADVPLRGIVLPRAGDPVTMINDTILLIPAPMNAQIAYGISYANPGTPGNVDSAIIINSTVVGNDGSGAKRALYVDQPNTDFVGIASAFFVLGSSNTIGIETNNPSALVRLGSSQVSGDNADISQTAGSIQLNSTDLVHSNANTFAFDTTIYPATFIWGTADVIPAGTSYLRPGTAVVNNDPTPILATQKFLAKAMTVHVETAPGVGESTEIRVMRKVPLGSPQPTQLFGTLTDANTTLTVDNLSVHFDKGDEMSVRLINTAGAVTSEMTVVIDIY